MSLQEEDACRHLLRSLKHNAVADSADESWLDAENHSQASAMEPVQLSSFVDDLPCRVGTVKNLAHDTNVEDLELSSLV